MSPSGRERKCSRKTVRFNPNAPKGYVFLSNEKNMNGFFWIRAPSERIWTCKLFSIQSFFHQRSSRVTNSTFAVT
jgi:hypothetical protein